MRKPSVNRVGIAVVAILSLGLAACGGSDGDAEDTTAATESSAEASTVPPTESSTDATTETVTSSDTSDVSPSSGDAAGPTAEDWAAIEAAANEEGSVTWYTSQIDPLRIPELTAAFNAQYPDIELTIVRDLAQNLRPKIEAEIETGNAIADVYSDSSQKYLGDRVGAGFVAGVDLPNLHQEGYLTDEWVFDDSYFLWSATAFGWGWNTDAVPDGIQTADDLVAPEMADRVGVPDPVAPIFVDFYQSFEEGTSPDMLDQLGANGAQIYGGVADISEALGSGEISSSIFVVPSIIESLKEQGAPVEWMVPEEPWLTFEYTAVAEGAEHPNAALVLANFMLSSEFQAARGPFFISMVPDVEPSFGYMGDFTISNPDDVTPEELAAFQARFDELFR